MILLPFPDFSTKCTVICASCVLLVGYMTMKRLQWNSKVKEKQSEAPIKHSEKSQSKSEPPPWMIRKATEMKKLSSISDEQLEKLNRRKPPNEWNTVIIFPDMLYLFRADSPLKQLLRLLGKAKVSLRMSVYVCSMFKISHAVADKFKEGLVVEIVSDYDTWTAHNNSGLKYLWKKGLSIKLNTNGYLNHNKFIIVDDEAVITGSLNWTKQGVWHNSENLVVTTDHRITKMYVQQFNKLWNKCRDVDSIFQLQ